MLTEQGPAFGVTTDVKDAADANQRRCIKIASQATVTGPQAGR
jgi:hypothetical protein